MLGREMCIHPIVRNVLLLGELWVWPEWQQLMALNNVFLHHMQEEFLSVKLSFRGKEHSPKHYSSMFTCIVHE